MGIVYQPIDDKKLFGMPEWQKSAAYTYYSAADFVIRNIEPGMRAYIYFGLLLTPFTQTPRGTLPVNSDI